jgi:hypothetical protein
MTVRRLLAECQRCADRAAGWHLGLSRSPGPSLFVEAAESRVIRAGPSLFVAPPDPQSASLTPDSRDVVARRGDGLVARRGFPEPGPSSSVGASLGRTLSVVARLHPRQFSSMAGPSASASLGWTLSIRSPTGH